MSEINVLSLAFLESKPKAAAELLREFTPEQAAEFLRDAPLTVLAPVIHEMPSWPAARALSFMDASQVANVLNELSVAEAETTLRLIPEAQREEILAHMPESLKNSISNKLAYPLTTVGAWMDTNVPLFPQDNTVKECLHFLRDQQRSVAGVVIIVDYDRRMKGMLQLEQLLTSDGNLLLSELAGELVDPLPARATLWEVEENEGWVRFPTLPVTDRDDLVLGVLTHSALQAGTLNARKTPASHAKFSLVAHIARSFFVVAGALLEVVSGTQAHARGRRSRL